jgi:hypothetical protein
MYLARAVPRVEGLFSPRDDVSMYFAVLSGGIADPSQAFC